MMFSIYDLILQELVKVIELFNKRKLRLKFIMWNFINWNLKPYKIELAGWLWGVYSDWASF